ncbi:MAG: ABC transporter substrate-binding protein [Desulfobacteraceae bacterium]|nr:ABC transporter substrate-binding protein [Desulfobacteraceae bacterium]
MKAAGIASIGVLAAAAVMLVMIAPGQSWGKEPYRIGGIYAITGSSSFLGDPEKKSMEMAVEEINSRGGIDGHPLEAVILDSEGDPTKAVLAANKLISKDKVIAIVGPSLTPTTLAIVPVVEKAGIPLISCAAGIKITEPVKPLVFKTAQNDVLAVSAIYRHIQGRNIKKIGIITVENAYGESGRDQLKALAPKFGINIVQAETYGAKDTDMTAQLAKLRAAQPEAIVCWGTNPGPAVITKNVVQMNMKIPLYQSHGVASPKYIELAGPASEGVLLPTGKILVAEQLPESDPQKNVLKSYIAEFEKRFSMPVGGFGGYAYDGTYLLAAALKGTEGDKKKIAENMEKIKGHAGVTGTFAFSPQDHNGLGADAFVMVEIRGGKWHLLK